MLRNTGLIYQAEDASDRISGYADRVTAFTILRREINMTKNIYDLKLHDVELLKNDNEKWDGFFVSVRRVPGGFIYLHYDRAHALCGTVFVPFNNEYQSTKGD